MKVAYKNYAGASLMAVGVFLLYSFVWQYYSHLKMYDEAIGQAETNLEEKEKALVKLAELEIQYKEKKEAIVKIGELIPETKRTAELISAFDKISQAVGVTVSGMQLSESKSSAKKDYTDLYIKLTTSGNYISFLALINALERNIRLLDVRGLSIARDTQNPLLLRVTLELASYFLNKDATGNK